MAEPGSRMALDEMIIKFTGRDGAVVKIATKPFPGIKLWAITIAEGPLQGYVVSFEMAGQEKVVSAAAANDEEAGETVPEFGITQEVVKRLVKDSGLRDVKCDVNGGRTSAHRQLYVDQLFLTLTLGRYLKRMGIDWTATLQSSRAAHTGLSQSFIKEHCGIVYKDTPAQFKVPALFFPLPRLLPLPHLALSPAAAADVARHDQRAAHARDGDARPWQELDVHGLDRVVARSVGRRTAY